MLATRLAQESLPPSPHCWEREARDPNLAGRGQRAKISKDPACTLLRDPRIEKNRYLSRGWFERKGGAWGGGYRGGIGVERVELDCWETCNSIARQRNERVWAKVGTYTVGASGFQRTSQVVALLSLFPQVWHVGAADRSIERRIHRADENRFVTLSRCNYALVCAHRDLTTHALQ